MGRQVEIKEAKVKTTIAKWRGDRNRQGR